VLEGKGKELADAEIATRSLREGADLSQKNKKGESRASKNAEEKEGRSDRPAQARKARLLVSEERKEGGKSVLR